MADVPAIGDAHNGVHREPCLMRQEDQHHGRANHFVGGASPAVNSSLHMPCDAIEKRGQSRDGYGQPDYQSPNAGRP